MNRLEKPNGKLTTTFLGELASRVENGEKIQFEFEGKNTFQTIQLKMIMAALIQQDYFLRALIIQMIFVVWKQMENLNFLMTKIMLTLMNLKLFLIDGYVFNII